MSTATKSLLSPVPGGSDLCADYFRFVAELPCGPQAKYLRRRRAVAFLDSCPSPVEWMRRPVAERLLQINRFDAWAFLSWCFATNRLVPDLELLTLKGKGTHFSLWTRLHPDDDAAVRQAAAAFDWSAEWEQRVTGNAFPLLCMTRGVDLKSMTDADLEAVEQAISTSTLLAPRTRRVLGGQHRCLRKLCYQLGLTDSPPVHPNRRERTPAQRADGVSQPLIRPVIARYLATIAATLRPATVASRAEHLTLLAVWLSGKHPECRELTDLTRAHLEEFLAWDATRLSQGRRGRGERISVTHHMHAVINLRSFFDDLTAWGWADRPAETVVHRADIPRPPAPLPRALAPQTDSALMKAVANLPDTAARAGITLLRGGGLRLGELLDLELDCLWDLPGHGTWLKVPLGKLNTERVVPLDDATLAALDQWMGERGSQRALPHPRTGRPADFLFTLRGTRIGATRIRRGLDDAASAAGLIRPDGTPEHVTPHQLRHTYATELVNAGMTLQALMALLGHVTPEMTTRYAHLADTTVRASYDSAMARIRESRQLPLVVSDRPVVPERIEWLHSEMLKTRVAHGYCSRHLAAEACPYANICEQCDNYTTSTEFLPQIEAQIDDETELRDDALERGWDSEVARHARVITSLQKHLDRLKA